MERERVMNLFRIASAAVLGLLVAACTSPDKPAAPPAAPAAKPAAAPAPVAATPPAAVDGLVAHWTLDDVSVVDATGRGHTGVIKGKVERVDGKIGGALQFPGGGDDHVEIPNAPDLENLQEGSYTVVAWFKPAGLPPGTEAENNANYAIVLKSGWHEGLKYTNEGKLGLDHWLKDDAWCGIGTWEKAFDPKQWHHVAGVVDRKAGQTRIYVNGALENTGDLDGAEPAREYGQTTWKIGIGSPGAAEWRWAAKGAIDDVRLYNKALSDAEVEKLYKAAK